MIIIVVIVIVIVIVITTSIIRDMNTGCFDHLGMIGVVMTEGAVCDGAGAIVKVVDGA